MAAEAGASFVVITGGEPLHHDLQPLTQALDARCGLPLHLETSGVDPPKRHRPPRQELLRACHELKVVVHVPEDISFAAAMASKCEDDTERLLQPGWESSIGEALAVEHVRQHAQWRLSLQSHKWLGIR